MPINMSDRFRFYPGRKSLRKKFINLSREMSARILYFLLGVTIIAGAGYIYAAVGVFPKNADSGKTEDSLLTHDEWNDIADFANVFTDVITVDDTNNRVGIGTTGPDSQLHVNNTATDHQVAHFQTNGGNIKIKLTDNQGNAYIYKSGQTVFLGINDNGFNGLAVNSSGNVGIGTTNPIDKLHVVTTAELTNALFAESNFLNSGVIDIRATNASYAAHMIYGKASGTDNSGFSLLRLDNGSGTKFVVRGDGNVGIGTMNPNHKLFVKGDLWIENASTDSAIRLLSNTANRIHSDYASTGGFLPLALSANPGTYPEQLYLNTAGNVGIGTTNPVGKLDVAGSICFSGDCRSNWATTGGAWSQNGSDIYYNSGNVGIGITDPNFDLEVEGMMAVSSTDNLRDVRIHHDGSKGMIRSSYVGGGSYTPLELYTSDISRVHITTNGNVGIGNANPTVKLEVAGNTLLTGATPWIGVKDTTWNAGVYFQSGVNITAESAGDYTGIVNPAGKGFSFLQSTTPRMVISSAGNIGIGTTAPGAKLDVNGTIKQGVLASGNTASVGSGVWTNVHDFSSDNNGYVYRYAVSINGVPSYGALGYVWKSDNSIFLIKLQTGPNCDVRLSGSTLQWQQNSGTTQFGMYNIYYGLSWSY